MNPHRLLRYVAAHVLLIVTLRQRNETKSGVRIAISTDERIRLWWLIVTGNKNPDDPVKGVATNIIGSGAAPARFAEIIVIQGR